MTTILILLLLSELIYNEDENTKDIDKLKYNINLCETALHSDFYEGVEFTERNGKLIHSLPTDVNIEIDNLIKRKIDEYRRKL